MKKEEKVLMPESVTVESMQDLVDVKATELKMKLNHEIVPLLIELNDEWIVGYCRMPNRYEKALAFGKIPKSLLLAGLDLLDWTLLKEHSDVRLSSQESKYDGLVNGAALKLINTVEILADECKKK